MFGVRHCALPGCNNALIGNNTNNTCSPYHEELLTKHIGGRTLNDWYVLIANEEDCLKCITTNELKALLDEIQTLRKNVQ